MYMQYLYKATAMVDFVCTSLKKKNATHFNRSWSLVRVKGLIRLIFLNVTTNLSHDCSPIGIVSPFFQLISEAMLQERRE